ncbi:MAG TPA: 30S ribosomal protein S18 [Candidatus Moranbacteria bacterium]|nr:30S ribosomal protein S18 [Candidatus Moranbacteria bacterium]
MNKASRNTPQTATKKECYLCNHNIKQVDYKDIIFLRRFINTVGKIIPPKKTGTCAKHQRALVRSIKRSRVIGLLPFVAR